jgi:hypothetical protein
MVGMGSAALEQGNTPLECRTAVVTVWPSRNRVLVQFAGDGPLVGFSGYVRNHQVVVDHMQLNDATRVQANGFCKLRRMTIVCVGRVERRDLTVGALVSFRRDR